VHLLRRSGGSRRGFLDVVFGLAGLAQVALHLTISPTCGSPETTAASESLSPLTRVIFHLTDAGSPPIPAPRPCRVLDDIAARKTVKVVPSLTRGRADVDEHLAPPPGRSSPARPAWGPKRPRSRLRDRLDQAVGQLLHNRPQDFSNIDGVLPVPPPEPKILGETALPLRLRCRPRDLARVDGEHPGVEGGDEVGFLGAEAVAQPPWASLTVEPNSVTSRYQVLHPKRFRSFMAWGVDVAGRANPFSCMMAAICSRRSRHIFRISPVQ